MDKSLIAYCGAYCGVCEWKDKVGCQGCKANAGNMFWANVIKLSVALQTITSIAVNAEICLVRC